MRNVDLNTARMMKDLGFNWSCTSYFDEELKSVESTLDGYCKYNEVSNDEEDEILAIPTVSQARNWIKNEFNIDVIPGIDLDRKGYVYQIYDDFKLSEFKPGFNEQDEALSYGIDSVIKLVYEKRFNKQNFICNIYKFCMDDNTFIIYKCVFINYNCNSNDVVI